MWFSDRPRPQQRLAATLGLIFDETIPLRNFNTFVEAFWSIIIREWPSIDHHRIDKFYLLLRRVVGCCFERLKREEWDLDVVRSYFDTLEKNVLSGDIKIPLSLPSHIIDIYIDELEKVMFADIEDINDDDEDDDEKSEEIKEKERQELLKKVNQQKQNVLKEIPTSELFQTFKDFKQRTSLKVLKAKIDDELFGDERLKEWKIKVNDKESSEEEESDDEDKEDDYFQ